MESTTCGMYIPGDWFCYSCQEVVCLLRDWRESSENESKVVLKSDLVVEPRSIKL